MLVALSWLRYSNCFGIRNIDHEVLFYKVGSVAKASSYEACLRASPKREGSLYRVYPSLYVLAEIVSASPHGGH